MDDRYLPEQPFRSNMNNHQRLQKYMAEQRAKQQPQEPQPVKAKKPQSDLQRMFDELKAAGVTQEQIDSAIDNLKEEEEIVPTLEAKLAPKKEEVNQEALRQEYQERFNKLPRVGLATGYTAAQRATDIYKLDREFRQRGMTRD